jgi:hypothetical protein
MSLGLVEKLRLFGRKIFSPDYLSEEEIKEVGTSPTLAPFKEKMAEAAAAEARATIAESKVIGRENWQTEFKSANGIGTLYARVSWAAMEQMAMFYKDPDWFKDEKKLNEFLRDNPQFKVKTTRGTRGQEIRH